MSPLPSWHSTLGLGTKVMVLDSEYLRSTPDVFPTEVRRFIDQPAPSVHSAQVAQVIASHDPLKIGIAPQCELYLGEVVGHLSRGWHSLVEALDWAIALKVDVLNMSFAHTVSFQPADERLRVLDDMGCICVASYNPYLHWPHSLDTIVSVGVTGQVGKFSVAARGEAAVTLQGKPEWFRGSSAAAALISGSAACFKSRFPAGHREQFIQEILRSPSAPSRAG